MSAFIPHALVPVRSAGAASRLNAHRRTSFVARPGVKAAQLHGGVGARKTEVRMIATGESLEDWLVRVEGDLGKCTRGIFAACKEVAYKIRTASCDKMACFNDFGDEQLAIDVLADKVIFDNLKSSGVVATASSEENPTEIELSSNGSFSVAFDPLDGSSIIDTNFSVGT